MLFDLDGTLTDPSTGIVASLRAGLRAVGVDPPAEPALRRLIGPPLHDALPTVGVRPDRVGDAITAYRAHYEQGAMFDAPLHPGLPELVAALAEEGRILALATSKPTPFADPIVAHHDLRDRLWVVGGATLDGGRRTKADVIEHVLDELGRPAPERVVMVGDRAADVNGARAHGIDTVAVRWGFAEAGELEAARPAAIADDAVDLGAALGVGRRPERWRRAARALVVDERERLLLVRWEPPEGSIWLAPGGGVDAGERSDAGLRRELVEELGLLHQGPLPLAFTRSFRFTWTRSPFAGQREAWYLARTRWFDPARVLERPEAQEEHLTDARWFTLDELAGHDEAVAPRDLHLHASGVLGGSLTGPAPDISADRIH